MEVYGSASFPMMSTQELIDWAKACHPNVSIHAYDSTWRKFMKHIASIKPSICLVFYIKNHHLYPIHDNHLKHTKLKLSANSLPIRPLPIPPVEVVCQFDLSEKYSHYL